MSKRSYASYNSGQTDTSSTGRRPYYGRRYGPTNWWNVQTVDGSVGQLAYNARFKSRPIKKLVYSKVRSAFAKNVKAVVTRMAETKNSHFNFTQYLPNVNAGTSTQVQIAPNSGSLSIVQGTGQGDRVGDRVRVKKAMFRGYMSPLAYDVTYNSAPSPVEVRMIIGKNKASPTTAMTLSTLFQNGDTSVAPAGTLLDMLSPINKETVQVYVDRIFKLGTQYGQTGTTAANGYYSNNDFLFNQRFDVDITKFLPNVITYNDTTAQPTSNSLFALFLCVSADGTITGANLRPVLLTYDLDFQYTDF